MRLTIKQTKALDTWEDKITTEILFGGGAGGGKSFLGCYAIIKSALKYAGTRWVIGRETLKTLKETTLNSFFNVCKEQGLKRDIHYRYNEIKSAITFYNGSEVLLKELSYKPSDPDFDELGSLEITGAFIDECNQIVEKAWLVLKSRVRYKLDENNLIPKILGSCNPAKNWTYMNFYGPDRRKELQQGRMFIQSLVTDNPFISKHYRENLLSLDTSSKERLLFGNWDYSNDPTELCDQEAVFDMFTNDFVTKGERRISADLAMQGRDRFIAGAWEGNVVTIAIDQLLSTGKSIEKDLKDLMLRTKTGRSRTVVDSDGLGNYLESYLNGIKEFHGGEKAIDHKEYGNIKSECAFKLAEMINNRNIKVICTSEQKQAIVEEIGALRRDFIDEDEKRKYIIKKKKMKELLGRSPDYLDVLIMGMIFHIKKTISVKVQHITGNENKRPSTSRALPHKKAWN